MKLLLLLYAMKGRNSIGGVRAEGTVSPGDCFVEGSENKTDLEVSEGCVIDQPLSLTARDVPITVPAISPFHSGLDSVSNFSICTDEASVV